MRLNLGPSLADLKAEALRRIDEEAEIARLAYVTPGSGQAMEYLASEQEARAIMALPPEAPIPPGVYGMIEAELGILGTDLREIAAQVVANADAWRQAGSAIKALRRGAKAAVEAATTVEEVRAARIVEWPSPF